MCFFLRLFHPFSLSFLSLSISLSPLSLHLSFSHSLALPFLSISLFRLSLSTYITFSLFLISLAFCTPFFLSPSLSPSLSLSSNLLYSILSLNFFLSPFQPLPFSLSHSLPPTLYHFISPRLSLAFFLPRYTILSLSLFLSLSLSLSTRMSCNCRLTLKKRMYKVISRKDRAWNELSLVCSKLYH